MSLTLFHFGPLPDGISVAPFSHATDRLGSPVHAVALFRRADGHRELDEILEQLGNPLLPVADFAGADSFRHDVAGSPATFRESLQALFQLASDMPAVRPLPQGADRSGLLYLGVAQTRRQPLQAKWQPSQSDALWYPSIGAGIAGRRVLENLADAGLMRRRFAHRLHMCGACDSHRLHVFEACISCGSGYLDEESVVHHFSCGAQGPESQFLDGRDLICPKCRKELRHFGIDYARPGQVLLCKACDTTMSEPDVRFVCADCNSTHLADQLETRDWFDYEITAEGVEAFEDRRLPAVSFDDLLAPHERAFSRREFRLLALEASRLAARYGRPLTAIRIKLSNGTELRQSLGVTGANEAEGLIIDLLEEQLRETDFFTNSAESELLVMLPETTAEQTEAVLSRFKARVGEIVAGDVELSIERVTEDALSETLESAK